MINQGEATAREIGAKFYKECSALLNSGVDDIFEAATRQAMLVRSGATSHALHHGSGNVNGTSSGFNGELNDRRKSGLMSVGTGQYDEKRNGAFGGNTSKGCCIVV